MFNNIIYAIKVLFGYIPTLIGCLISIILQLHIIPVVLWAMYFPFVWVFMDLNDLFWELILGLATYYFVFVYICFGGYNTMLDIWHKHIRKYFTKVFPTVYKPVSYYKKQYIDTLLNKGYLSFPVVIILLFNIIGFGLLTTIWLTDGLNYSELYVINLIILLLVVLNYIGIYFKKKSNV